jgi:Rrf2 family protein
MISKKTKYGLKALIYLARHYQRGPVLIADLAHDERIPKKFLETILLGLKNNGILHSKKGKGGGYYLGRHPGTITFGQAIRVMEGPLAPVPCVSEMSYATCSECDNEVACGIRLVMKDVRDAMAEILDGTTLQDVLDRVENANEVHKGVLNFCI